jgi:hypothetical protein
MNYKVYKRLTESRIKTYYLNFDPDNESLYLYLNNISSLEDPIDWEDFCGSYRIEYTPDMQVYADISYLEKGYRDDRIDDYETSDSEDIQDACIGYGVRGLINILEEYENKFKIIIHEDIQGFLNKPHPSEVFKIIKDRLDEEEYWDDLDDTTLRGYCEELNLDYFDTLSMIKNNFHTKGKASRTLLSLLGEGDLDINFFERLVNAMSVAKKRHSETEYDSIDKSSMTADQVANLRKGFNS